MQAGTSKRTDTQLVLPAHPQDAPSRRQVSALPALQHAPASHPSTSVCLPVLPGRAVLSDGLGLLKPSNSPHDEALPGAPCLPAPAQELHCQMLPVICKVGPERL